MLGPWPQGLQIGFPNQFNGTVFQLWCQYKATPIGMLDLGWTLALTIESKRAMLVASLGPWFSSNQNAISYLSIWNPKNPRSTYNNMLGDFKPIVL